MCPICSVRRPVSLALLTCILPALLLAQDGKVTVIHVRGSRRFAAGEVIAASGLPVGAPFSVPALDAAAHRLADTGAFSEVDPRVIRLSGGVILDWYLADAPQFLPARFEGFSGLDRQEIAAALAKIPLYHGSLPLLKLGLIRQVQAALQKLLEDHHLPGKVAYFFHFQGVAAITFFVRH
ncbi:MAG TPA: hypothetical protein VE996_12970 [Terriglobales bacterium]|nr:hypothetical protein [Terriglobales bacterium]